MGICNFFIRHSRQWWLCWFHLFKARANSETQGTVTRSAFTSRTRLCFLLSCCTGKTRCSWLSLFFEALEVGKSKLPEFKLLDIKLDGVPNVAYSELNFCSIWPSTGNPQIPRGLAAIALSMTAWNSGILARICRRGYWMLHFDNAIPYGVTNKQLTAYRKQNYCLNSSRYVLIESGEEVLGTV